MGDVVWRWLGQAAQNCSLAAEATIGAAQLLLCISLLAKDIALVRKNEDRGILSPEVADGRGDERPRKVRP